MRAAREHFQRMTALSRESWQLIMAETDDNQEWIPNPRQQSVIPGARVTEPMVAAWQRMLDELDAILEGRKLAPFWRGTARRGINVARFFEEPRTFDLVLLIQGWPRHGKRVLGECAVRFRPRGLFPLCHLVQLTNA
jgi:hypothetical protein